MLEIRQMKLPYGSSGIEMEKRIRRLLRLKETDDFTWKITRHSIDARKHPDIYDIYTVCVTLQQGLSEKKILACSHSHDVYPAKEIKYHFPSEGKPGLNSSSCGKAVTSPDFGTVSPAAASVTASVRPVIAGFGPAGMFAALELARAGFKPLILERGAPVDERVRDVEEFWRTGVLRGESNVQFGEGGAGTFSDGKLTTGVKDSFGRKQHILEEFISAGAPEDIAYEQYPHIGTDLLRDIVRNIREKIISFGGEVRFHTCLTELISRGKALRAIRVRDSGTGEEYEISCENLILACGHSSRDTVRMLYGRGITMQPKNFAVGFRVSHPQELFDRRHYGGAYGKLMLPPTSYSLSAKGPSGRGVYSFCMCPGGYIVNASSEKGRLAVNGMSDHARDSGRANSAIIMTCGQETFGSGDVLAGMKFQEKLEERAFRMAGGRVPVLGFPEFEGRFGIYGQPDPGSPSLLSPEKCRDLCIKGLAARAPLYTLFSPDMTFDFISAMHEFEKKYPGFCDEHACVAGLESRTSSPVRILRDEYMESSLKGLYPCGEGAGYAGGIMSAAIDGIKVAEMLQKKYTG